MQTIQIALRSSSLALCVLNIAAFFYLFGFPKNKSSILFSLVLVTWLIGVLTGVIYAAVLSLRDSHDYLRIIIGVGNYLISTQLFNWTLYIRFRSFAPLNKLPNIILLFWLSFESLISFIVYVFWITVYIFKINELTLVPSQIYAIVSIEQTLTGLLLSGWFLYLYYIPLLKTLESHKFYKFFWSSGLLYLILETFLSCLYTFAYTIPFFRPYYTAISNIGTALRYSLFLVFLYQIRNTCKVAMESGTAPLHQVTIVVSQDREISSVVLSGSLKSEERIQIDQSFNEGYVFTPKSLV